MNLKLGIHVLSLILLGAAALPPNPWKLEFVAGGLFFWQFTELA